MNNQVTFLDLITFLDKEISLVILGNNLLTNNSFCEKGSLAESKIKHAFIGNGK